MPEELESGAPGGGAAAAEADAALEQLAGGASVGEVAESLGLPPSRLTLLLRRSRPREFAQLERDAKAEGRDLHGLQTAKPQQKPDTQKAKPQAQPKRMPVRSLDEDAALRRRLEDEQAALERAAKRRAAAALREAEELQKRREAEIEAEKEALARAERELEERERRAAERLQRMERITAEEAAERLADLKIAEKTTAEKPETPEKAEPKAQPGQKLPSPIPVDAWLEAFANGATYQTLADTHGTSRELIRRKCVDLGLTAQIEELRHARKQTLLEAAKAVAEELIKENIYPAPARVAEDERCQGLPLQTITAHLEKLGLTGDAQRRKLNLQSWVGRKFGDWIITGWPNPDGLLHQQEPTCRCVCGVVRTVQLSNLRRGVSRGCGCKSKTGRRMLTPWIELLTDTAEDASTGQTFDSTNALARELDVLPNNLIGALNKARDAFANDEPLESHVFTHWRTGRTFKPLVDRETAWS